MKRDQRDPQKLGEMYLLLRAGRTPISVAVRARVSNYDDGGIMSNDPDKHHSNPVKHPEKWAKREEVFDV
jgi:hypothetical protein